MKKKLTALLVALCLLAGVAVPAGAMETSTRPGESWRMEKETFYGQFAKEYAAAHPEEYGAFDDEAYAAILAKSGYSEEELMTLFQLDEETLHKMLWLAALEDEALEERAQKEYQAYITQTYEALFPGEIDQVGLPWAMGIFGCETLAEFAEQIGNEEEARNYLASCYVETRQMAAYNHETSMKYREQYPGSYESYDPDKGYEGYWAYMKGNNMARYGLQDEVEWKEYMYVRYMPDGYIREQEETAKREEYPQRWPEEYAGFDPYAWYAGYYHDMGTPESYMEREGLDAEGFKRTMFMQWVDRDPTGFFNGYCVTVDGTPIQFQFYRDLDGEVTGPKVENERILIPLRAAAEALGLVVEWKPETSQVVCANEKNTVTFTLGSREYSGGALDSAPFAEKGVTYLPLRALGETLGCGVEWKGDFATAALTTVK